MKEGKSSISPSFIVAKSAVDLEKKMLQNNFKYHTEFKYFCIHTEKGKFYAWYNFDHSHLLRGITNSDDV